MTDRTSTTTPASDHPIAAVTALLVLPFAIYIAFWRIDWTDTTSPDSVLRYVLPVVFCIVVPSICGSIVGAIVNASRRD